jgi:hypothetical protein
LRALAGSSALLRAAVLVCVFGLFASPGIAQGADTFVDFETGDDTAPCGPINDPCRTLQPGINAAGAGDTVHVDETVGQYTNPVGFTLGNMRNLIGDDFVAGDDNSAFPEPDTVLQGGDVALMGPSLRVPTGDPAGTIQGLRLRSGSGPPVTLEASATLTGNVIDEDGPTGAPACLVRVEGMGNTSTIGPGNTFVDPTPDATPQAGVCAVTSGSPSVTSNTFTNLNHGVQVNGGNTSISSNTFSGIQDATSNAAIEVTSGTPTIAGNLIQLPGDDFVLGIALQQTGNTTDVGATLRRNTILGHRVGVAVNETEFPVSLNGDLIAKSGQVGLATNDAVDNDDDAAVTVDNVTIADNVISEISLNGTQLTLISSLLAGTFGITTNADADCAINFSRGPSIGPGCSDFQTTAPPGFVNPAANDYHLGAGSAMIDMGEPGPASPGIVDLDGEARVTDGNGDGTARRDIGADERPTAVPPTATPPVPITPASGTPASSTPQAPPKKKCKKKRKKRADAAAKRKGCKRKRGKGR